MDLAVTCFALEEILSHLGGYIMILWCVGGELLSRLVASDESLCWHIAIACLKYEVNYS